MGCPNYLSRKAHANSLYRPEDKLHSPWEGKYRGNQGVTNMGLKHPSVDPVCWMMGCTGLSQQYLAIYIALCVRAYAAIATHKGGSCRWRHKGQGTTGYFLSTEIIWLLLLLLKEEAGSGRKWQHALEGTLLLLPFPFPHEAWISKAFPASFCPSAASLLLPWQRGHSLAWPLRTTMGGVTEFCLPKAALS